MAVDEAGEERTAAEVAGGGGGVGERGGDGGVGGGADVEDVRATDEEGSGEGGRAGEAGVGAGGDAGEEDEAVEEEGGVFGCHFGLVGMEVVGVRRDGQMPCRCQSGGSGVVAGVYW